MGGTSKKLIGWTDPDTGKVQPGWAHYEFGEVDGHPGNCANCAKHHRDKAAAHEQQQRHDRLDKAKRGIKTSKVSLSVLPPCETCSKAKLHPDNYGLDPANETIVRLYRMAAREQRVGTFAGAPLMSTLSVADAIAVMDEYRDNFPTQLHRQRALELMTAMGHIAVEKINERDEKATEAAKQLAKQKPRG